MSPGLAELPEDLLEDILVRVNIDDAYGRRTCCAPPRDLVHATLVCRGFSALARNPQSRVSQELFYSRVSSCKTPERVTALLSDPALEAAAAQVTELAHPGCRYADDAIEKVVPALRRHCPKLRHLGLGDQGVTALGCQALATLTSLRSLELELTYIDSAALAHLTPLTGLTGLGLCMGDLRQSSAALFQQFAALRWLHVPHAKLPSAATRGFAALTQLEDLDIENNDVCDEDLQSLAGLTRLQVLTLSKNPLTERCLPALRNMQRLSQLYIFGTKIDTIDLAGLQHVGEIHTKDKYPHIF